MNVSLTRAQIEQVAAQIAPMCDGDEQLLQDMLEGETDLISVASRIHEQIARDNEMLVGIAERKSALAGREKRIKDRAASMKAQIGALLRAARLTKLELPEVTYSVRDGKPTLEVVDPSAVPEDYLTYKPTVNKSQINADFAPGDELPNWLTVKPASDVVTGRVK
jgi:hypothetical protein